MKKIMSIILLLAVCISLSGCCGTRVAVATIMMMAATIDTGC